MFYLSRGEQHMDTQDQPKTIVDRLVSSRRDVPIDAFDEPRRSLVDRLPPNSDSSRFPSLLDMSPGSR
jgi:hypothetical protein